MLRFSGHLLVVYLIEVRAHLEPSNPNTKTIEQVFVSTVIYMRFEQPCVKGTKCEARMT